MLLAETPDIFYVSSDLPVTVPGSLGKALHWHCAASAGKALPWEKLEAKFNVPGNLSYDFYRHSQC